MVAQFFCLKPVQDTLEIVLSLIARPRKSLIASVDVTEKLSGHDTEIINLGGMTVVTGFIDSHVHVLSSGTRHIMAADCDQQSIEEVQKALRRRTNSASKGE